MFAENYQLVVRRGPKPGQVYPLLAPTITVGRDPMSDIVLNDPEVSRYHAQLVETTDGYQIQDMGSTNGTYVAGKRIGDEPVLLQIGQDVAFGSGIFLMYEAVGNETNPFDDNPFDDDGYEADVAPKTAVPQQISSPFVEPQDPPPPKYEQSPPPPPLVPSADDEAAKKRKRLITIAVAAILLLCLCCILLIFAMYQWGGDWLIQQLEQQAALVTPQLLA